MRWRSFGIGVADLRFVALLTAGLLAVACTDSSAPAHDNSPAPPLVPTLDVVGDQTNGTFGASGTQILKGFNPTNPHIGDAIVATFFWLGSTNIVTSVSDHLADGTPVGNSYSLVEYVTAGGISMATYVATNVSNFPDPNPDQNKVLVVQANLSASINDGGIMISAYSGVQTTAGQALGAHRSASGSGSSASTADPGAIMVTAGALAYGVTLSNGVVGLDRPPSFTNVSTLSDASMKADGEYAVEAAAGSVDPQWTWYFSSPSTWLATVVALNPAGSGSGNQPPTAAFTSSCNALTCAFTSTSSDPDGSITAYSWTFGDGGTSTAQNPSHTYAAGGTYTVTLQVTDNQGATNSTSKSVTVTAPNQPPVVNAGPDQSVVTGLLFTESASFSDPNNDGPWTYTINWGDGSTTTGSASSQGTISAGHTYIVLLPKSFTITVTVTDSHGASGSDTKVVSVLLL